MKCFLFDFNDVYTNKEEVKKKTTRRSRVKKTADAAPVTEVAEETIEATDTPAAQAEDKCSRIDVNNSNISERISS